MRASIEQTNETEVVPSLYQPDEKSKELMKKWVIKPQLEKSPKWRLFGRQEKEEIQQQVLSGIIPQGSAAISDTAEEYTRALEKLLGKIQALEIAAERADQTLVDGCLQVGHTHPFSPEGFLGQRLSRPKAFLPEGFLAEGFLPQCFLARRLP